MTAVSLSVAVQDTTPEGVLSSCGCSHSDTHYLNRHMVGYGCHEILSPRSLTFRFLLSFLRVLSTVSEFSLFLCSNVDSGRCSFVVVQNWRIRPRNGNLLEEWSNRTEESFFLCQLT
jgi:hypothetical protein